LFIYIIIGDPTDNTIVAFTDDSCQGNPGPCGSGAVLYPGDNEEISLKRLVAQRGSILLAEFLGTLTLLLLPLLVGPLSRSRLYSHGLGSKIGLFVFCISSMSLYFQDLIPIVGNTSHLDMPNPQIGRVLIEMRTGYSKLNKYQSNIGQSLTPLCDCREEETTEHYILHCFLFVLEY
jgi:hypothetical protein